MIYILYFIVSAAMIVLSQELAYRSGTPCYEWEDVQLIEPKKSPRKQKKFRKVKNTPLYLVASNHESETGIYAQKDSKWA